MATTLPLRSLRTKAANTQQEQELSENDEAGLTLVPGRRQRLGDQLYGQILDQILSGRLQEGDRLPPEKEISRMFGVSRPIVRQALLRLRVDGLLQARQGAGTFVMMKPATRLKSFTKTEDVSAFLRCIEARLPLEAMAARLAAERRTAEQLARIEIADKAFADEMEQGRATPAADIDFHVAVAAATGNEFFSALLQHIHEMVEKFMSVSLSLTRTGTRERAQTVLSEHRHILDAIRTQDAEQAQVAMHFHISQARRRLLDGTRDP